MALVAALLTAGAILFRLQTQITKHRQIETKFAKVVDEVMSLSGRFSIIISHAVDYINALGPDIAHEIYHVQKILHAANAALAEGYAITSQRAVCNSRI